MKSHLCACTLGEAVLNKSRQSVQRHSYVAQLLNVTATLSDSISRECHLYCVCTAVQLSARVCVFRVGLCVDSLCSQLTSFSHPAALKEGVEWDCCPWSLEAYV